MKEIGFVATLVLILCGIVYWSRSSGTSQDATTTTYESAINAAKTVKGVADADARRRWVLSLQLTAAQNPDTTYSTEGDNAEILIVRSDDADNASCSASANGELGSSAAAVGFTEIDCRNGSTGAVYKKPISLQ
jgi:hypothetical protein